MAVFFAQTSRGLVDILFEELAGLDVKDAKKIAGGVSFVSNWQTAYLAHLRLRSTTRLLLPILDFTAYDGDSLYKQVLRHDFTKYIRPHQTLAVYSQVTDSTMHDQRFVALKVKDAIVDQFRNKYGSRPDVDKQEADLQIHVRVKKNLVSMAVDLTGESLSNRGYREATGEAPIREHLAAAMVKMTGWTPDIPLIDPMCGSGTFLIEAARMAKGMTPTLKRQFCFQNFLNFDQKIWQSCVDEIRAEEKPQADLKIFGSDHDASVLKTAKTNARNASVDRDIKITEARLEDFKRPCEENGVLIVNPPYGERLLEADQAKKVYRLLGDKMKQELKGWTCWVLSGHEELSRELRLKAGQRIPLWNGPIECRLLKYEIQ